MLKNHIKISYAILLVALILGIVARFFIAKFGHNFDLESYKIVAYITDHGGNVYASTSRYNYGPVWFNILHLFSIISSLFKHPALIFRVMIISLLTLSDIGISALLYKKFGSLPAVLFFLNPISIAITGYHNQFDNLAILIGFVAVLFLEKSEKNPKDKKSLGAGVLLLGLSLMTKHLLFILPFWLAIRQIGLSNKIIVFVLPPLIFLLGFLPFWTVGHYGIVHNVFLYKSFDNAPFFYYVLPKFIQYLLSPMIVFVIGLVIVGYITRKLTLSEAFLWYLVTLVMLSPAIANQYLAIAMPAIAVFSSLIFLPYVLFSTFLLWGVSPDGLHLQGIHNVIPVSIQKMVSAERGPFRQYDFIIVMLFLGVMLFIYKSRVLNLLAQIYKKASLLKFEFE